MSDKSSFPLRLPPLLVAQAVTAALEEDLGQAGDITTDSIVAADAEGEAAIVARQDGVVAGLDLAEAALAQLGVDALEHLVHLGELAADLVRTAVAPTWDDISKLAVIATIRTMLNYFLAKDIAEFEQARQSGANQPLDKPAP